MANIVQHNITAMNSNRMLGVTTKAQAKSTEKLSSGYKINRAADDAAGLSISEKMRKQIRGLTQASANAQDGISAVQTAEGALGEVQDMLQRMNELAVKSANGTNSASDRDAIQAEIDQLTTEIDRVSETTKFNETYLLKGDASAEKETLFQYKEADVTKMELYSLDSNGKFETLEKGSYAAKLDPNKTYYSAKDGFVAGQKLDSTTSDSDKVESKTVFTSATQYYTKDTDGNFKEVAAGTEIVSNATYYTAAAGASGAYIESEMKGVIGSAVTGGDKEDAWLVKSGEKVYDSAGIEHGEGYKVGAAQSDIENFYNKPTSGFMNTKDSVDISKVTEKADKVQFVDKDGNEIAANGLDKYLDKDGKLIPNSGLMVKTGAGITDITAATKDDVNALVDTSAKSKVGALTLKLHVGADATTNNQISIDIKSMSAETLGVKGLKVDGEDDKNALDAIETIKAALNKVSDQRSALGAVQNRLEHTIKNLDNVVENTTSAESAIRDTDMASEMVTYSKNNILAQAGQSMLAQANQSNQGVLSLLG